MKKTVLLLLGLILFVSCSKESREDKSYPEMLPITNHSLPSEFKLDSIYSLEFQFNRPTTCHIIDGFYYEKNNNTRKISIASTVLEQNNCERATVNSLTRTLSFSPQNINSYLFKIWKGKDANNQDIFEEIEIPVVP